MDTATIETFVKILDEYPKDVQERAVKELPDYLEGISEEMGWVEDSMEISDELKAELAGGSKSMKRIRRRAFPGKNWTLGSLALDKI